jgi:hypothetical protein
MHDGVDSMGFEGLENQLVIAHVADHEGHAIRHRPAQSRRQIVEHHGPLAGIQQSQNHVAADIAGSSSHENVHGAPFECCIMAR